ncbi:MAG: methylenetetrahydrofolate dehydrogenase / methenyltetrahydrofolate cyclohydrolase [Blastocatellia bacterium]|jgi:methylenetetrahydrofolate dehydrogenase (NADP+)/methenyltetrahydrofolate cyclohydrolase|nr:methylenetetrahydrofolate dehydrogenase / methenyltetrahydrofolate cyclohydrolase [Blastocatellia bacterium]MDX6575668.1 methylenetetrahydrofolate dehydrogenase / methenyltetrahydrofolate cyclohydrolase [Blastocatellia bacterium]
MTTLKALNSGSRYMLRLPPMVSAEKTRAQSLDGRAVADQIKQEVAVEVQRLLDEHGLKPRLAAVLVGDDDASAVYVRNKVRACAEVGIESDQRRLPATTTTAELLTLIRNLNQDEDVDGILVQLPLPQQIDEAAIIEAVDPAKDVDGFHPVNVGLLAMGKPRFVPCTPAGIIELLDRNQIAIAGANACVVGRSQIVGRPVAGLLLQRNATVTICHSRTRDLPAVTRQADILVAAIGRPAFIRGDYIKPGAVVIDVGVNKVTDIEKAHTLFGPEAGKRIEAIQKRGYTLVGDVHPAEADLVAGRRTPVPGGVGLLTVAMLMKNTLQAAKWRRGL